MGQQMELGLVQEALSALALAFSRASSEAAGSPT